MKKVLLFLFLCCTFMAVSCSELNNGDGGKTKAELLIGKWQAIKTETYDGKGNLIETYYPDDILNITDSIIYSNVDGEEALTYSFDEDHQWIVFGISWIWTVTKLTKDELVIKCPDFDEDYEDGWFVMFFKKVK